MTQRLRLSRGDVLGPPVLDNFLDGLLQKFENCRDGLTDAAIAERTADDYFARLYEAERDRLRDIVRLENSHLPEEARERTFTEVDRLVREVVLPAYVRLAVPFTVRERNGFYLLPERLNLVERVGFAIAGTLVGMFVVWAPFIPLWSKEWVLPFFLGGLIFPELRRWWELRSYERKLNRALRHADAEVQRVDVGTMLSAPERGEAAGAATSPEQQGRSRAARRAAEGSHGHGGGSK